jgi:hypothetical protein
MTATTALPPVPPAHAGVITDAVLEQVLDVARRVPAETVTDAEGSLFLMSVAPCLEELLQWRRKAALVADIMAPNNLLMFPGAR